MRTPRDFYFSLPAVIRMNPIDRLKDCLVDSPVIWRGEYAYFVHPIRDGIPRVNPELLISVTEAIESEVDWNQVDVLVGIEAMGLPLSTLLSVRNGKPLVVARKRSYGLEGEMKVDQSTGYSKGELYLNDLHPGDRVLIVDDVLSTGGTMRAMIQGIHLCGAEISRIVVVFEKGDGLKLLQEETGLDIRSLIEVAMDGDKIVFPGD